MPAEIREKQSRLIFQRKLRRQVRECIGASARQNFATECQRINPGAETMQGESPQEAFFRAASMRHDPATAKACFAFRPQRGKRWGIPEIGIGNTMDLLSCPGDWAFCTQITAKEGAGFQPQPLHPRDADLDRDTRLIPPFPSGFKIECGK